MKRFNRKSIATALAISGITALMTGCGSGQGQIIPGVGAQSMGVGGCVNLTQYGSTTPLIINFSGTMATGFGTNSLVAGYVPTNATPGTVFNKLSLQPGTTYGSLSISGGSTAYPQTGYPQTGYPQTGTQYGGVTLQSTNDKDGHMTYTGTPTSGSGSITVFATTLQAFAQSLGSLLFGQTTYGQTGYGTPYNTTGAQFCVSRIGFGVTVNAPYIYGGNFYVDGTINGQAHGIKGAW